MIVIIIIIIIIIIKDKVSIFPIHLFNLLEKMVSYLKFID
jgi:hypothetical protein